MVVGDVVNTASRLQSAAPVNGVLVGAETHAATRTSIAYAAAAPVLAKGKAVPIEVWLALSAAAPAGERKLSEAPARRAAARARVAGTAMGAGLG